MNEQRANLEYILLAALIVCLIGLVSPGMSVCLVDLLTKVNKILMLVIQQPQ